MGGLDPWNLDFLRGYLNKKTSPSKLTFSPLIIWVIHLKPNLHFSWLQTCSFSRGVPSLKLTDIAPEGVRHPKRNNRIPSIHFQVLPSMLVSGRVCNEKKHIWLTHLQPGSFLGWGLHEHHGGTWRVTGSNEGGLREGRFQNCKERGGMFVYCQVIYISPISTVITPGGYWYTRGLTLIY